jgi:predicted amino acid dehydrogenase
MNTEKEKYQFAFLVHPRHYGDILKNMPYLRFLPSGLVKFLLRFWPPFIVTKIKNFGVKEKNISNKDSQNYTVNGLIIGVPLMSNDLLQNKPLAEKRILRAIKMAENMGVKIIGLGALTSPSTDGGKNLIGKIKAGVTTGNSLTAAVVIEDIKNLVAKNKIEPEKTKVALLGATGSIGWGVSRVLVGLGFEETIFIGRTPNHLNDLEKEISKDVSKKVTFTTDINELTRADIIIVTTSASDALIKEQHLKSDAIIYDITQPSNVSRDICKKMENLTLIEGGQVTNPTSNSWKKFGLPDGAVFSCLAETMLLAVEKKYDNYSIGKVEHDKMKEIISLSKKYGIDTYFSKQLQ